MRVVSVSLSQCSNVCACAYPEKEEEERSLINRSSEARPTRCRVDPARVCSPQVDLTRLYVACEINVGSQGAGREVWR